MQEVQRVKIDLSVPTKLTVPRAVKIPSATGELVITFDFKHRSRRGMNAFNDFYWNALRTMTKRREDEKLSLEWEGEQHLKLDARTALEAAAGWNADLPFNVESLEALFDRYPPAASLVMSEYRAAIIEGRSGN